MTQLTFSDAKCAGKRKQTREVFLAERCPKATERRERAAGAPAGEGAGTCRTPVLDGQAGDAGGSGLRPRTDREFNLSVADTLGADDQSGRKP